MKELKIAEIVPVSCLEMTAYNQYHMCLAHLVRKTGVNANYYARFYKRMSEEGKYVLMDNGAAEGSQLNFDKLIKSYDDINPTEIVLPDVLLNSQETINRSVKFYEEYKQRLQPRRLMAVPQGRTFEEWCECADELMNKLPINTIGVSKFLEMTIKDPDVRMNACNFLNKYDVEIHLLGCSEGPAIVKQARNANPHVRGCDSAFVYICAKAGVDSINELTTRAKGEIDFLDDPVDVALPRLLDEFEKACGLTNNLKDDSWR